jgi:hypothetical protein
MLTKSAFMVSTSLMSRSTWCKDIATAVLRPRLVDLVVSKPLVASPRRPAAGKTRWGSLKTPPRMIEVARIRGVSRGADALRRHDAQLAWSVSTG